MQSDTVNLDFGRDHLSIPGPSVMPDRVLNAMHRPAPNIYGNAVVDLTTSLRHDLNKLAGNSGHLAFFIGNGHAAWEASICNTFSKGDKALFLLNGRFGSIWAEQAASHGVDVEILDFGHEQAVNADRLEERLREDTGHEIKAVLTVQTDTASSSSNDLAALRRAIDSAGHPALYIVDSIASFACEPLYMDETGIDVMITATQKGLMTPPGVALVFMSEAYLSRQPGADLVSPYWNAHPRIFSDHFADWFFGTPPTHHLFALREAVDMLLEEGILNTWQRHKLFASSVWAAVDAWGSQGSFACRVGDQSMRSTAVTTIKTAPGVAAGLRRRCESEFGVVLGVGLNPDPTGPVLDNMFRIGHMGHLNVPMLMGTLGTIEAALCSDGVPHGPGAIDAAARIIATR